MRHSYREGAVSPDDAVAVVRTGARVFLHGACATPVPLVEALARRTDLTGVDLYHLHTSGPAPFVSEEAAPHMRSNSLFTGPACRAAIAAGRADFIPVFLSDIPGLFTSERIPLDVAVVQVSPPDRHGHCTLGPSVDAALAAVQSARVVVAEVNAQMPRTSGNAAFPFSAIDRWIATDRPLVAHPAPSESDVEAKIGALVADLVEDGATLQMGIGAIPDAVMRRLDQKNDLGIHTEMFSDNVIPLIENGNVNNRRKAVHQGRTVTSFVAGTQRLFDFVDDNQRVEFYPCDRTNDTALIRKNPKVTAINSALEVDLTGQVCADSMGHRIYSGIGGQMDFIRGAARSVGGKPIIALPATAKGGSVSRITAELKPGAGVVTTRGHVHWVVTEYGAVDLHGLPLRRRAEALVSIAHPDVRPELRRQWAGTRVIDLRPG
ncbi:MAG: acetyl-CoA hydrolase/transferase C-terminal domain-containing protein [Myxococcota bacterium]